MTPFSYEVYTLGGYLWEKVATTTRQRVAIEYFHEGYKVFIYNGLDGTYTSLERMFEGCLLYAS